MNRHLLALIALVLCGSLGLPTVARADEPAPAQASQPSHHKGIGFWTGLGLAGVGGFTALVGATDRVTTPAHRRTLILTGAAVAAAGAVTMTISANKQTRLAIGPRQVQIVRIW